MAVFTYKARGYLLFIAGTHKDLIMVAKWKSLVAEYSPVNIPRGNSLVVLFGRIVMYASYVPACSMSLAKTAHYSSFA